MRTLNVHSNALDMQFPIEELESIESMIEQSKFWLRYLERRRSLLLVDLDCITCPDSKSTMIPEPKPIGMGFMYKGEWLAQTKYVDIHVGLLRRLWIDYPARRCDMARAMGRFGASRVYVATSLNELFPLSLNARRNRRFSRRLEDEWLVDTNLNLERMRKILPAAIEAVGLKAGVDVIINWR